jgi:transposase-like protein
MMSERGVMVDHTTLFRWVQHYAPLMEKRVPLVSALHQRVMAG